MEAEWQDRTDRCYDTGYIGKKRAEKWTVIECTFHSWCRSEELGATVKISCWSGKVCFYLQEKFGMYTVSNFTLERKLSKNKPTTEFSLKQLTATLKTIPLLLLLCKFKSVSLSPAGFETPPNERFSSGANSSVTLLEKNSFTLHLMLQASPALCPMFHPHKNNFLVL